MEDKLAKIKELEELMQSVGFWNDKAKALEKIRLHEKAERLKSY